MKNKSDHAVADNEKTSDTTSSPPIECRNLWKIFGKLTPHVLTEIQGGDLTKSEIQDRFGCVVGVADASFRVYQSEIFCVMGLSGSGKSTLIRHINRLIEPTAGHRPVRHQGHVLKHHTNFAGSQIPQLLGI